MMALKKNQIFVIIIFALVTLYVFFIKIPSFNKKNEFKSIFINETDNHQFDDSIRVSIIAAESANPKVQHAVIITNRFNETELERNAIELFAKLNLGRNNQGRAILYLYSPANHALKIEVSSNLEPVLPDTKLNSLEKAAKGFLFKNHDQDFWAELIHTVNLCLHENQDYKFYDFSKFKYISSGGGVFEASYDLIQENLNNEIKKIPNDLNAKYQASASLKESLNAYFQSLSDGVGDVRLPLLSNESRLFRLVTPMTTYQIYRNLQMMNKAGIDQIFEDKKIAFIFFKPHNPVLPLIFINEENKWKIQEPMSWALFQRFEDSREVYLKYPIKSTSLTLSEYLNQRWSRPLFPEPELILNQMTSLTTDQQIYFKYYWLDNLEKSLNQSLLKINDSHLQVSDLWVLLDIANNLGRFQDYLKILQELIRRNPKDDKLKNTLLFYQKQYTFDPAKWITRLPL